MFDIAILNPAVNTANDGDRIIIESVKKHLGGLFPNARFNDVPTHGYLWTLSYQKLNASKYKFVGGTNLLSSNMLRYNQWKINYKDYYFLKDVVLMGVGWWQYQKNPNLYTQTLLKKVLHKTFFHSVRDSYTLEKLKSAGIHNVLNTGCPTMWELDEEHCKDIPSEKAENVLLTITDYKPDVRKDNVLIAILKAKYKKIYLWCQGAKDAEYSNQLNRDGIVSLDPGLSSLDELLASRIGLDYVGTRLHAGLRAIRFKKRAFIVSVDNRALEMAKDFNLNVIDRNNLDVLEDRIDKPYHTSIKLPLEAINKWKQQFANTGEQV